MTDQVVLASQASIDKGSQSFAAAAKLFDGRMRIDAAMLYAWCRHCDDVIDGQDLGHRPDQAQGQDQPAQALRLQGLREQTRRALRGEPSADSHFEALRQVAERNAIPPRYPEQHLDGFAMDVAGRSYRTLDDTIDYCYHVAGVVGVMMALVMGARKAETLDRACDLGIAFQLTNICRDVIEDRRAGRSYLPQALLAQVGYDPHAPQAEQWARLHEAALVLLATADRYYASAFSGLADLPFRAAWAVAAARRVYRAIGRKLVRQGPAGWNGRVSTTRGEKTVLLMLALGDAVVTRVYRPQTLRNGLFARPVA